MHVINVLIFILSDFTCHRDNNNILSLLITTTNMNSLKMSATGCKIV